MRLEGLERRAPLGPALFLGLLTLRFLSLKEKPEDLSVTLQQLCLPVCACARVHMHVHMVCVFAHVGAHSFVCVLVWRSEIYFQYPLLFCNCPPPYFF